MVGVASGGCCTATAGRRRGDYSWRERRKGEREGRRVREKRENKEA